MNILLKKKNGTILKIKSMKLNTYLKFHNNNFYGFFDFIKCNGKQLNNDVVYTLKESIRQHKKSYKFLGLLSNYNDINKLIEKNPVIDIYNI